MENIGRFGVPLNDPAHRSFGKAPRQAVLDDAPTLPDGFPALGGQRRAPRQGEPQPTAFRMGGARPMGRPRDLPPYTGPVTGEQLAIVDVPAGWPAPEARSDKRTPAHATSLVRRLIARHGTRFTQFGVIGTLVLVLGITVQGFLVRMRLGPYLSYGGQAVFSIELSYLLNRRFTWRDLHAPLWSSWWRFNAQKAALTAPNLGLYALLIMAGIGWLAANLAATAVCTVASYLASDLWSFAAGTAVRCPETESAPRPVTPLSTRLFRGPAALPSVSVIIPCRESETTIRATVEALLGQDYPALAEVILVGDIGDSTWTALEDISDPRLLLLEQERTPGLRDPNVKRDTGIRHASGEVLALADSDIVMDSCWLSRAVGMLLDQGGGLVAGGMRTIHDSFWGRFVDRNTLAAKTPRLRRPYRVTAANFGKRGCKPPVTANAVFTRDLYQSCPLDVTWSYGYEDYEWFWRLARGGHKILFSGALTAAHHHRRSFKNLAREYRQSAHGCAYFIRAHRDSPLAKKRRRQAFGLPIVALGALAAAILAVATGHGIETAAILGLIGLTLTGREVIHARSLEAATYPPATLALGWVFTANLAGNLLWPSRPVTAAPTWEDRQQSSAKPARKRLCWPLVGILTLQSALSSGLIWSNTVFGDEATYLAAGRLEWAHWLHGAPLPAAGQANFGFVGTLQSYFSGAPQIYPPIGALVASVGGLAAARVLGLMFMLGASVFLYLTAKRLCGQRAALLATGLWAVSGPTLRLAFATYDPMAICLVCAGTWIAVEAGYRKYRGELIVLAGLLLALGAITAYSYAIFAPAAITLAAVSWVTTGGVRRAVQDAAWLAGLTTVLLLLLPTLLKIWPGIFSTTLARHSGQNGILSVVVSSWGLAGLVTVLAVVGAITSFASDLAVSRKIFLVICAAAAFMVPLEQVHLQTGTSLDKHLALGAWFACLPAGYGLSRFTALVQWRRAVAVACAVAGLAFPAVNGWEGAFSVYHLWPDASTYIGAMRPLTAPSTGNLLVIQDSSITEFYLGGTTNWQRWTTVSMDPSYQGVAPQNWTSFYRSQLSAIAPGVVALPMEITFTSQGAGDVLLSNLADSLKTRDQEQLRKVLLQIAATDMSSAEPGFYALASAVADDPRYRVTAITPYNSHIATGIFVIWQRTSPSAHETLSRHVRSARKGTR